MILMNPTIHTTITSVLKSITLRKRCTQKGWPITKMLLDLSIIYTSHKEYWSDDKGWCTVETK